MNYRKEVLQMISKINSERYMRTIYRFLKKLVK